MNSISKNKTYKSWIITLKLTIQKSQIKAAIAVNRELILLYWDLGNQIADKQENSKWGSGFIEQLSKDLKDEFPEMKGFSRSNLFAIKKFYTFYRDLINLDIQSSTPLLVYNETSELIHQSDGLIANTKNGSLNTKIHQVDGQIDTKAAIINYCVEVPWLHNIVIIEKIKNFAEVMFYLKGTIKNNWSRSVLQHQIETGLFNRQRKTVNNFAITLPTPQSDLAIELLKDPYNFDFLQLTQKYNERDIEKALTNNITTFLLELGNGFSFVGKQYLVKLSTKDYYIDLLFYHLKLRCFVVIELKAGDFKPDYTGKINFYINVVNKQLKHETDNPTIGIIICKSKNAIEAEYALGGINAPIGITDYELNKILPESYKGSLPSIEDIEAELNK